MSRIGNLAITLPKGVEIVIQGTTVNVKGPKGSLSYNSPVNITFKQEEGKVLCTRADDTKESKSLHGLARTLVFNMIEGATKGFEKKLEIIGVGYRAQVQGKNLVMGIGYSHDVIFPIPEGIKISVEKVKNDIITISGIDKQLVGQVTANIRKLRPPEPYKGKGIRYVDEHVVRKEGKRVGASAS